MMSSGVQPEDVVERRIGPPEADELASSIAAKVIGCRVVGEQQVEELVHALRELGCETSKWRIVANEGTVRGVYRGEVVHRLVGYYDLESITANVVGRSGKHMVVVRVSLSANDRSSIVIDGHAERVREIERKVLDLIATWMPGEMTWWKRVGEWLMWVGIVGVGAAVPVAVAVSERVVHVPLGLIAYWGVIFMAMGAVGLWMSGQGNKVAPMVQFWSPGGALEKRQRRAWFWVGVIGMGAIANLGASGLWAWGLWSAGELGTEPEVAKVNRQLAEEKTRFDGLMLELREAAAESAAAEEEIRGRLKIMLEALEKRSLPTEVAEPTEATKPVEGE